MVIFLSILFGLIVLNAALLIFSVNGANQRIKKTASNISNSAAKIYPLDSIGSKYKKAV